MMIDDEAFAKIELAVRLLLGAIEPAGPSREGMRHTPRRVAQFWRDFVDYNPGMLDTSFESIETDQMVVLSGIRVYSMCEHHLLPFTCDISIGYITGARVVGVSKLARIAQKHAHRLQMQERLCNEIAADVVLITGQESVAVLGKGQHMCMRMRGVRTEGVMVTSVTYGAFRELEATRAEFLKLVEMSGG